MTVTYLTTLCDRLGNRYGPLRLAGGQPMSYGTVLNGGGTGTLNVKYDQPLISGTSGRQRLRAWSSEVVIERFDDDPDAPIARQIVAAGPVLKPHGDLDTEALTVTFAPLWQWLMTERLIVDNLPYGGWDQIAIARDLITRYTTGLGPAGDIRMAVDPNATSGVKVSQLYQPGDQKQAGQAVVDLASAHDGFDFDVELSGTAGAMRRLWRAYYPQKGRRVDQPLTAGRGGLRNFAVEDATTVATRVTGFGQVVHTEQAAAIVEAQFGIHSTAMSLTDSNSLASLVAQVVAYLGNRTPPVDIVSFSYKPGPASPFGFLQNGDTVRIKAGRGWMEYDNWVRMIGQTVTVDGEGNELVACVSASVPGGVS